MLPLPKMLLAGFGGARVYGQPHMKERLEALDDLQRKNYESQRLKHGAGTKSNNGQHPNDWKRVKLDHLRILMLGNII